MAAWLAQAAANRRQLLELLSAVHRYRIPPPRSTQESLIEFDRRRGVKETLLEQIIAAAVETGDASRLMRAVMSQPPPLEELEPWERPAEETFAPWSAATRRPCARGGRS